MRFYLKQKDYDVAVVEYEKGKIYFEEAIDYKRLPFLISYNQSHKAGFKEWLHYRSIPKTRRNLSEILEASGVESIEALTIKNLGLSLSDSYWLCPDNSNIKWHEINLYENDFCSFPVQQHSSGSTTFLFRPDSSSNGELEKVWEITDGKRILLKESTKPYYQQAYNERFADILLTELNLPHVQYSVVMRNDIPYSACSVFTSQDVEYVPAWYLRNVTKKNNSENAYQYFLRAMNTVGVTENRSQIDAMLAFDFLINNSDRHFGNFGFLRDVNTLEFVSFAPLFDHGNSMWGDALTLDINRRNQPSKPFRDTFDKQNKLLGMIDLPLKKLTDDFFEQTVQKVYSSNSRFDYERLQRLTTEVKRGRDTLLQLQLRAQKRRDLVLQSSVIIK